MGLEHPPRLRETLGTPTFLDPEGWRELELPCDARYLECRLDARRGELDYLLALPRAAAKSLPATLERALAATPALERERWKPLVALTAAWADGLSPISLYAPTVWLEFDDIEAVDARTRFPSVSVCLTPSYDRRQAPFPNDPARELPLIASILELLDAPASPAEQELLAECYPSLPQGSRWIHVSRMLGRTPAALKLYGVLPRAGVLPYLDLIGWAGDRAVAAELLDQLYPADLLGELAFVDVNLSNLRDRATCTLGLAVAQQHVVRGPDSDPLRRAILERWCAAGLASSEKVTRLHDVLREPGGERALRGGRFLDLKLVWHAALGTSAKAYLGFHRQAAEFPWSSTREGAEELARFDDDRRRQSVSELATLDATAQLRQIGGSERRRDARPAHGDREAEQG